MSSPEQLPEQTTESEPILEEEKIESAPAPKEQAVPVESESEKVGQLKSAKTELEKAFKEPTREEIEKVKWKIEEEIQNGKKEFRSFAMDERWKTLSPKEQERYYGIDEFAEKLDEKIKTKRQELASGKDGVSVSQDFCYSLMAWDLLEVENMTSTGFFERLFSGKEIKIPGFSVGKPETFTKEELATRSDNYEEKLKEEAKDVVMSGIEEKTRQKRKKKT